VPSFLLGVLVFGTIVEVPERLQAVRRVSTVGFPLDRLQRVGKEIIIIVLVVLALGFEMFLEGFLRLGGQPLLLFLANLIRHLNSFFQI